MNDKKMIIYLRKQSNMWEKNCEIVGNKYVKLYAEKYKKKNRRDLVWHIYHTILALELGAVAIIEFIELMYK